MLLPITLNSGRTFSTVSASPPTMKVSSPERAWLLLPVTGASRNGQRFEDAAAASSCTHPTLRVLHSTHTVPGPLPSSAPASPSQICREASSSATMLMITSARAAASYGEPATDAPCVASPCALSRLRLNTVSGKPALRSRCAMPEPMMPRPRKATRALRSGSVMGSGHIPTKHRELDDAEWLARGPRPVGQHQSHVACKGRMDLVEFGIARKVIVRLVDHGGEADAIHRGFDAVAKRLASRKRCIVRPGCGCVRCAATPCPGALGALGARPS